jgi:hypothetical protein
MKRRMSPHLVLTSKRIVREYVKHILISSKNVEEMDELLKSHRLVKIQKIVY